MLYKYRSNLTQYLNFLELKYRGKLQRHLSLPPWANVVKLLTTVIFYHSMVITAVILFYDSNTMEWQ
jgi:hypothetical protein